MMPSTPCFTASAASSPATMPLRTIFIFRHVADAFHVFPVEFYAGLSLKSADRAEHVHRRVLRDARDLREVCVAANAAIVGFAVQVANSGALHRFRADGVGAPVVDGPDQHGATGGLKAAKNFFVHAAAEAGDP